MKFNRQSILSVFLFLPLSAALLFSNAAYAIDCDSIASRCTHNNSQLYAVAHQYGPSSDNIIYRINVPAWSPADTVPDAGWNGNYNGFFYQVNVLQNGEITDSNYFVPFNGIHIGADRLPKMPAFHMFPLVQKNAETVLEVKACSSNYSGHDGVPDCQQLFWSNTYSDLPDPVVFDKPPFAAFTTVYTLRNSNLKVADNGVYSASLILKTNPSLTPEQLQLIDNHTLFFRQGSGKHFSNDIHHQGIGILEFDEATYLHVKDQLFHTRYGDGEAIEEPDGPSKRLFFYATNLESDVEVGISSIFDLSGNCDGFITGIGSNVPDCSEHFSSGTPSFGLVSPLSIFDWKPETNATASHHAGLFRNRSIDIQLTAHENDENQFCEAILSPLAIYPSEQEPAFRPVNYLISNKDWEVDFPMGLYYVIDNGFGDCASQAPFCHINSQFTAYMPHYYDTTGGFGLLNGGSTDKEIITGMRLADQYAIGSINDSDSNSLSFFDQCGYGHRYVENDLANARKALPAPPENWQQINFSISNELSDTPLVYAKECCASWYQKNENTDTAIYEPPQQLDNQYGLFVPYGQSIAYQTLFKRETMVVYDAVAGNQRFKIFADLNNPALYACQDDDAAVEVIPENNVIKMVLGKPGNNSLQCNKQTLTCPLGMTASVSASQVSCSTSETNFLLGLKEWGAQSNTSAMQIRAWGGKGGPGQVTGVDSNTAGAPGGAAGYALTVMNTQQLPSSLYVYMGKTGEPGKGGSSTLLSSEPLSRYAPDELSIETRPEQKNILLIAPGGGSGGLQNGQTFAGKGGNGAITISNAKTLSGFPVSAAGQKGQGAAGGNGGNQSLFGDSAGNAAGSGIGGFGGGDTERSSFGTLIPALSALDWHAGNGDQGNDTGGGGGFGGGTYAEQSQAGAGGGGGWSAANTIYDATAPTFRPVAPSNERGTLQFVYVTPPCKTIKSELGNTVRCIYHEPVESLDLHNLAQALFGSGIDNDLPVFIEAWGGSGGNGTAYRNYQPDIGKGGSGGYARSNSTLSNLIEYTENKLNLYPGSKGKSGSQLQTTSVLRPYGGDGGASTIVSGQTLQVISPDNTTENPRDNSVVLLAAGGGGGGSLLNGGYGGHGGAGGLAIANTSGDQSCGGFSGGPAGSPMNPTPDDAIEGLGGNLGSGQCGSGRIGQGGSGGNNGGGDGASFIGGFGGHKNQLNSPAPGWVNNPITNWVSGNGAGPNTSGGGGGGGFGAGGAAGKATFGELRDGGGGGGGGSWALQSQEQEINAPILGYEYVPSHTGNGAIAITFDICSVDPESHYCSENPFFFRLDENINLFIDQFNRKIRMIITGDESFDVNLLDTQRVSFGFSSVRPIPTESEPKDFNQDGFDDIEIRFQIDDQFLIKEMLIPNRHIMAFNFDSVHCIYGGLKDGTPLTACARPKKIYRFENNKHLLIR